MARVHHRKAAKAYPNAGIAKGDMYYYVKIKTGPRSSRIMRSKTPFKRSQLTQSDYLAQLYDWEDGKAEIASMEEAQDFCDTIRALGEEQAEKLSNMPDGLREGNSGEILQNRADACETAAGEIEEAISEWEDAKSTWETEIADYRVEKKAFDEAQEAWDAWNDDDPDDQGPEPDVPDEPDLPDHTSEDGDELLFDESEWLERVRDVSVDE